MISSTGKSGAEGPGSGPRPHQNPAGGVRLRRAERRDLEAAAELDKAVFPALSYPLFVLRQHMDAQPQSIFLVIEEDGVICGYALASVISDDEMAWLLGLAVSGQHRGRRYGDRLLRTVMRHCLDSGVKRVLITVRPNNEAALGLYEKYHFRKTSSEENYYGDLEPRVIMQSVLRDNVPGS